MSLPVKIDKIFKPKRDEFGNFVKGFRHSKEWKEYIGKLMRGREIAWKEKISKSLMGHPGQKGAANYFYGKHLVPWNKGVKFSEASRRKMSEAHRGKTLSDGHRKRLSEIRKKMGIKPPIIKGEKHYAWKGGITPLVEKIRRRVLYKQWRSAVFHRDDFTCQLCKQRGGRLEVDHFPKPFSKILEDFNISEFEKALKCGLLWDTNNGRTLCKECHYKNKKRL